MHSALPLSVSEILTFLICVLRWQMINSTKVSHTFFAHSLIVSEILIFKTVDLTKIGQSPAMTPFDGKVQI